MYFGQMAAASTATREKPTVSRRRGPGRPAMQWGHRHSDSDSNLSTKDPSPEWSSRQCKGYHPHTFSIVYDRDSYTLLLRDGHSTERLPWSRAYQREDTAPPRALRGRDPAGRQGRHIAVEDGWHPSGVELADGVRCLRGITGAHRT